MIVRVAPMGGRVADVNVEAGSTVSTILSIAGIEDNGRPIRVDNVPATLDTRVTAENAIITLAEKMKGGRK